MNADCSRCGGLLTQGDRVLEVRVVNVRPDGSVSHDRGDALAHVTCPGERK